MLGDQWDYYPGATVAPTDPTTTEAQNMALSMAREGSPNIDAAQAENLKTLQGGYYDSNPYLDATYNRAASGVTRAFNRAVLPNLESRFAGAGRMDSGAYQGALGEAGRGLAGELSGMATDIYGGAYQAERGRQNAAVGAAAPLAKAGYMGADVIGGVGAQRERYNQAQIDEMVQRFQFEQEAPYQSIARYANLIGSPVMTSSGRSKNWGFSI